jgi:single-strand DNA-binding protein
MFSLATDEVHKNKAGEKVSQTEWHSCQAWGKVADIISKYVKKGHQVYVEGMLRTQSWDDKEGKKQYKTIVEVMSMQMLEKAERSQGESTYPQGSSGSRDEEDMFDMTRQPSGDLPF